MDLPARFHFTHRRVVEFADTDLAGVMHYSNFLRFAESAEHAWFRSLGFRVHTTEGPRPAGWPRLEVSCRYLQPARFEQTLAIGLRLAALGPSTLTYRFWIFDPAPSPRALLATGACTIIHVAIDPRRHHLRKTPIPAALRRVLQRLLSARPPTR